MDESKEILDAINGMDERRVKVRVSFDVGITVPMDYTKEDILFYVEENHCPGTGSIGNAVDEIVESLAKEIEKSDKTNNCWACLANGKNKVISISGMTLDE